MKWGWCFFHGTRVSQWGLYCHGTVCFSIRVCSRFSTVNECWGSTLTIQCQPTFTGCWQHFSVVYFSNATLVSQLVGCLSTSITTCLALKARKPHFRFSKTLQASHCKHNKFCSLVYASRLEEPQPGIKPCVSEVVDGNLTPSFIRFIQKSESFILQCLSAETYIT